MQPNVPIRQHLWLANSSVWGQDTHVPQGQRSPLSTSERTVFPCGLVKAAQAETAQRDYIKAPGEEMTTIQISESEDEPVRTYEVRCRLTLNEWDTPNQLNP